MSYPTPFLGTIISAPIRPSGPSDSIATAYTNEIKGGHHAYETITERDAIVSDRRDWNMLATIYNDVNPDNNKTYQLFYNHYSTSLADNQNWVTYNPLGLRVPTEWVDSVLSITSSNPTSGVTDGDRFLIVATQAGGLFTGSENKIVQYDSTKSPIPWSFYIPTNGMTLRVDNQKNILYKYSGTYSSGLWTYEYMNQVRYLTATSSNGTTYSASSGSQTPLDTYSYSVYYVNFGMTNSGDSVLNIDSLGNIQIKKLSGSTLANLSSQDIVPSNTYQLIYNNGIFQTTIVSNTSVIGPAEDGDYTDGLYTDFTSSTPIGTAVDRFNEVLKALVPPSAPDLSSWSSVVSGVSGKLSFDGNTNVSGQTFSSATQSTITPSGIGDSFNPSGYRIGIISSSGADLTGTLNSAVSVGSGTPTPAYATYSFGYGMTGTMSLLLNGNVISTISLGSTSSAIDSTTSGATSGIAVSAATSSFFPSGFPFPTFMNRTGTWRVKRSNLIDGYNYIVVRHDVTLGQSFVLSRYEVVLDSSVLSNSYGSGSLSVSSGSTKYLSGLQFYTGYSLFYSVTIDNVYRNTYNAVATITDSTGTFNTVNITAVAPASPASQLTISGQTITLGTNKRRYNQNISLSTNVTRTVQGVQSSGGAISQPNLYIDNYTSAASLTFEDFIGETYRRTQNVTSTKYPNNYFRYVTDITGSGWGTFSIASGVNGTGLQVVNGGLQYPQATSHNSQGASTFINPNFGISDRDYSGVGSITNGLPVTSGGSGTSYRTYIRYFQVSTAKAILQFACSGSSFTVTNAQSVLSGNNIWFEVKIPYDNVNNPALPSGFSVQSDGSSTGWLDASKNFTAGQYGDGAGCYYFGSLSGTFQVNLGLANTTLSNGYVLVRITAPSSWSGQINGITVTTP